MMRTNIRQPPHMHAAIVLLVLILTYIGMAAGRIAWLRVDRTGIALLAVIALLASGEMTLDDFGSAVDMPTVALLFAMMIISAQFAESGFIDLCARTMVEMRGGTTALLALTVAIGGVLSAVLANDILVVAIAPLLLAGARRRGLDPRPFALALAASINAGSSATLIGNPQNILLGAIGRLDFADFLAACGVPALFALLVVFAVVWLQWHRRIRDDAPPPDAIAVAAVPVSIVLDRNQTIKGGVAVAALLILFATPLPREIGALIIAALLLANRKITSRTMIAAVDWPLLLLVSCLFAITGQLNEAGIAAKVLAFLDDHQLLPNNLAAAAAVCRRDQQRDRQRADGDAAAADLAGPAFRGALCAGAVVDAGRQSPAHREPDQPGDRRTRRADRGAAHLCRLCPRRDPDRRCCRSPSRPSGWR